MEKWAWEEWVKISFGTSINLVIRYKDTSQALIADKCFTIDYLDIGINYPEHAFVIKLK